MEILALTTSYSFAKPMWLFALLLLIPVVYIAMRSLVSLSPVRRWAAIVTRCVLIVILVLLLARFTKVEQNDELTVISVIDRSKSIPATLLEDRINYIEEALKYKPESGRLAVVDIAELASITKLSSNDTEIRRRNTAITGQQSKLSEGVQMALAIAPPNTAARILLVSDGNETEGDVKQAAEIAAMNNIPIDVLPVEYAYDNEVIFKRLNAPVRARSNQTISLRFVLNSTSYNQGKMYLSLNGTPVDLVPESIEVAADVQLKPGTNVQTISLPVGTRGVHEFEAVFVPNDAAGDQIEANNRSSAITYVAGPGNVLVVDADEKSAASYMDMLTQSEIEVEYMHASEFPDSIARLMDTDAIVLANTSCSNFSYQQQEMLVRYVTDIGGGLIMTGGPDAFGAGGWIGSPVQEILPVDLDPPQKKQLPKGALVLIMHSCEMPQGNLWGERIAIAATRTLSRLDLIGVLAYNWNDSENGNWVYPLSEAGDKEAVISSIKQMSIGDMPDLGAHIQLAYDALKDADAAQKHIIVISDGDPAPPTKALLDKVKAAGITCSGVAVFPHSPNDVQSLHWITVVTNGRFYNVKNPQELPKIFIKEAQVIKRALILEQPFIPQISFSLDEILKGISGPLPVLDGFVLTGPKGGLSRVFMTNNEGDPVAASGQAGLGRCAVFTSALDSRWGTNWLAWDNGRRFAEQLVRWAAKPGQASDCEILVDVQGNNVNIHVEALDSDGQYMRLSNMNAQMISPNINSSELSLSQVGPGQYKGTFEASMPGSHLLNLRYRKLGRDQKDMLMQTPFTVPFAPEFNDLTDNISLLRRVCELSGGRMIETEPAKANLFDTSGVKFPQTHIPLTQELMLLWLAVFLFDVAVRRIAIDFKAGFKKLALMLRSKGKTTQAQQTLTLLKKTQKKMQKRLYRNDVDSVRKKRFEASHESKDEMPISGQVQTEEVKKPAANDKPRPDKSTPAEQGHIQQLLNAKKKAIQDKDNQNK